MFVYYCFCFVLLFRVQRYRKKSEVEKIKKQKSKILCTDYCFESPNTSYYQYFRLDFALNCIHFAACIKLQFKSMHFALQNHAYYRPKCGILQAKTLHFAKQGQNHWHTKNIVSKYSFLVTN